MRVQAGTEEKGDVLVVIEPAKKKEIFIKSKVQVMYGEAIKNTVKEMTKNLKKVKVEISDKGALEWVLRARMEAAMRKYRGEKE